MVTASHGGFHFITTLLKALPSSALLISKRVLRPEYESNTLHCFINTEGLPLNEVSLSDAFAGKEVYPVLMVHSLATLRDGQCRFRVRLLVVTHTPTLQ